MFIRFLPLTKYLLIIVMSAAMGSPVVVYSETFGQVLTGKSAQNQVSPPTAVARASGLSPEARIAHIEERLNLALALKDERIESINERSENTYKIVKFFGLLASAVLIFFSFHDAMLRSREGKRQRSIEEIVKDMMNLQKSAMQQQLSFGLHSLTQIESNTTQQFETVKNVNAVIDAIRQTLSFRLEQEKIVAEAMADIKKMREERAEERSEKLKLATAINDHLNMSRMEFASLTDEQYKRGLRLQGLVNELKKFLTVEDFEVAVNLLYTCGVVAFYDNDIIEAKSFFDQAAARHAPQHDAQLTINDGYREKFALIHYFRALIHKNWADLSYKNWGDLSDALHEIEQSAKLFENKKDEFLTPVTKAEIQSYIMGSEEVCRNFLEKLIEKMNLLETELKNDDKALNRNQVALRHRMFRIYGNTYFAQKAYKEALDKYHKVIALNPDDYYALSSAARCERELNDPALAEKHFSQCLDAIERSGDFRKKRERISRAVIAVIAANAAGGCGDQKRYEQYKNEAVDLLSGKLEVDGLSPKFFSPSRARLVSSAELLQEI